MYSKSRQVKRILAPARPEAFACALVLAVASGLVYAAPAQAAQAAQASKATKPEAQAPKAARPEVVPLSDGVEGMTCYFYAKAGNMRWEQAGGDWLDADGTLRGTKPFSQTRVPRASGQQPVHIDLTALARTWSGSQLPGAVLLRSVSERENDTAHFLSREHDDRAAHPSMIVEWDDGKREVLTPRADTYFACPTHKGLGHNNNFRIGGDRNTILLFPWTERPEHKLVKATLALTTNRQHGRGATAGVFLPTAPFGDSPLQAGFAGEYDFDAGIDDHPDVIFADRFEDENWPSGWSNPGSKSKVEPVREDASNRFEPLQGKALKVTVEAGARQGLNMHLRFARQPGGEPEEAYFRYYLRLGESWNPVVTGGKLPGLSGTYGKGGWGGRGADGTNGWSARGIFFQQVTDDPALAEYRPIGSYLYHVQGGKYGSNIGWNLGPTGMLQKNRWYSIEQYVKMNSPGEADGILRAWVDGKLAYEKTDVVYRTVPDLKIESVWMNVYHGGTEDAPSDLSLFIDNVVVARSYIGPVGTQ